MSRARTLSCTKRRWVIESAGRYWRYQGGCTSDLTMAQLYATRREALEDLHTYCDAAEASRTRVVAVVATVEVQPC